jgi:TM2 domain-containing membrane protein YozV
MKKFFLILIFFSKIATGQDLISDQYQLARDLFLNEDYFEAVTEFKRLLFFDSGGKYAAEAEYYIGLSYKAGGFYSEAVRYLSNAARKTDVSLLAMNARKELIKTNILRRTTTRALQLIDELEKNPLSTEDQAELHLLRGFTYIFANDLNEGIKYFRLAGYNDLAELTKAAEKEKYSETKARILSVFIPGAGQIYTGRYLNGILSLALNAASIYLTVTAFMDDRIFDGIITANLLWYRFYAGNIYNAGKFARENNQEILSRLLKTLQEYKNYQLL